MANALPKLQPLEGLIFRVVTIHGERNEMVLRCLSDGRHKDREMTVAGTRSLSQGEYLWMTTGADGDTTLQRCLNAS